MDSPNSSLFGYLDYRKYLADYLEACKKADSRYSYQKLADHFGFKAKDFLYRVIRGSKNLSPDSAAQISKAARHTEGQAAYFALLVKFCDAKKLENRNLYYELMNSLKVKAAGMPTIQKVRKGQYEFYSKWFHSAIRSLIDMHGFDGDYSKLAHMVTPKITPRQAQQSVRLLDRLGLVVKGAKGHYQVSEKVIATGPEVRDLIVSNFHVATTQLAAKAVEQCPREERDISCVTLGISKKTFEEMRDKLRTFRRELMAMAEQDADADRVYQLNLHLFPMAKPEDVK